MFNRFPDDNSVIYSEIREKINLNTNLNKY